MDKSRWLARAAAGALVTVTLLGIALAAGQQGSQSDPLVTLSYLTEKATPDILAQADAKAAERAKALTDQFSTAITNYTKSVEDKLSSAGGVGSPAVFSVVELAAGQKLTAGVGCELMLRVGSATCSASSSPALIDMTDGGSTWDGSALIQNHLYMATVEGRGVVAKDAVKLLVRGSYAIG
jgi:hypothetical protein